MSYAEGEVMAGYTIVRELGSGGMGAVYLARHPRLPRLVALKVLNVALVQDNSFRLRFEREADLAAKLFHRNIVTVLDRGSFEDQLWIAMQYVDGIDVSQLLSRSAGGGLPLEQVVHIVGETAAALEFAHQHHLMHRDVKPANIMLAANMNPADPDLVLLADFGLAQIEGGSHSLTGTGNLVATLAYASPEQIEAKPFDHRVDIYALGCVLYELLTGEKPFPAENLYQVMQMHLKADPPRPSARRTDLPAAIDDVVLTAMAKNPDQRYASARDLGSALRAAAATPAPLPPAGEQVPASSDAGPTVLDLPARLRAATTPTVKVNGSARAGSTRNVTTGRRRSPVRLISALALIAVLVTGLSVLVLQRFGSDDIAGSNTITEQSDLAANSRSPGSAAPVAPPIGVVAGPVTASVATTTPAVLAPSATMPPDSSTVDPEGFTGEYQYRATLVQATGGGAEALRIGTIETASWTVRTSCAQTPCISQIQTSDGGGYLGFTVTDGAWVQTEERSLTCQRIGAQQGASAEALLVPERLERSMAVSEDDSGQVTLMTGRTIRTQLEPCPDQFGELLELTYDVSLTRIS